MVSEEYALLPSVQCITVIDQQKGDLCALAASDWDGCNDTEYIDPIDQQTVALHPRLLKFMEEVDVRIWSPNGHTPGLRYTLNPFPLSRLRNRIIQLERLPVSIDTRSVLVLLRFVD